MKLDRAGSNRWHHAGAAGMVPPILVRFWWITLLRGVFGLLLGISVLWSGARAASLITFMGLYWLAGGVLTLRWALGVRWVAGSRLGLVAGLSAVAVGALALFQDQVRGLLSPTLVTALLGGTAILTGALRTLGAFETERRRGSRWTWGGVVLGAFELGLGTMLIMQRALGYDEIVLVAAMWALVSGTLLFLDGMRLRRLARHEILKDGLWTLLTLL